MKNARTNNITLKKVQLMADEHKWDDINDITANPQKYHVNGKIIERCWLELSSKALDEDNFPEAMASYRESKKYAGDRFSIPMYCSILEKFYNFNKTDAHYLLFADLKSALEEEIEKYKKCTKINKNELKSALSLLGEINQAIYMRKWQMGELTVGEDGYDVYFGTDKVRIKVEFTGEMTMTELYEKMAKIITPMLYEKLSEKRNSGKR